MASLFWIQVAAAVAHHPTLRTAELFQTESDGKEDDDKKEPETMKPAATPLAGKSIYGEAPLPRQQAGTVRLPKLTTPTTDLSEIGTGSVPQDKAAELMRDSILLPKGTGDRSDVFNSCRMCWRASNTFSYPLYFEDAMLERHGHELDCRCCLVQPLYSGARFFGVFPALPYLMTVQAPCDCYYSLGHWRPGGCAPSLHQRPPWQRDAALIEAASIAGGILIFP
jgi:hypothetical protein